MNNVKKRGKEGGRERQTREGKEGENGGIGRKKERK